MIELMRLQFNPGDEATGPPKSHEIFNLRAILQLAALFVGSI
jgi:hypothetical protein